MITFSNIYYRYPGAAAPLILKGIDFTIGEGDYVLLCGRSGSGKSTLGYLFNGLIPHFFEGILKGNVSVLGQDTRELAVSDLLSTVGMVFQNADAQLFNSSVENELAFGLESLGLGAREIEKRIHATAQEFSLEHLLDRSPMSLSGGEKRLVSIASVLILNPPVMVLDEPLAHLDWEGARKIRETLVRLHRKGKTLVVIEQRVNGILDDASRCVVLDHGEVAFDGSPNDAGPVLDQLHLVPKYPPSKGTLEEMEVPILQARNLSHWLENKPVLQDISLDINDGEIIALVGKNGAGKTTLIKHFNGLLRPGKGIVRFGGKDIRNEVPSEIAASVGISLQNANDQFFKNTVRDELMAGLRTVSDETHQWIENLISLLDLKNLLNLSPYRLSEGQKKRVAIASVLAMQPRVLILDEPTVGQDGPFLETLASILDSLRKNGVTIAIVTHDLQFARAVAQRLVFVDGGKVTGIAKPGTREERKIFALMDLTPDEEQLLAEGRI